MDTIKVVALASSEDIQSSLYGQLKGLDFIEFDGVCIELADAVAKCQSFQPDVIIVDMTGRELDTGLFIQAIGMNPENPCVIFALHKDMDIDIFKDAVRRGAKEFIQYPSDQAALDVALKKHMMQLSKMVTQSQQDARSASKGPRKGKIYTVFAAKGGAGSSSVAVNLAYEIRQTKLDGATPNVVYFDLDQFYCNSEVFLRLRPEYSLGDIAQNNPSDVDVALLEKITAKHDSGLHLVVGSKDVLDDNDMISAELLEVMLNHMVEKYDYVIVDLPTHVLDPYHQYMVERADTIVLVSGSDIVSLSRTRQYLNLAQKYLNLNKIKLVLNRYNLKAGFGASNQELEALFNFDIFARIPNDWDLCVDACSIGKPLSLVNPKAEIVKTFQKLAADLTGEAVDQPLQQQNGKAEKPTGNLLGKLFGAKSDSPQKGKQANVV